MLTIASNSVELIGGSRGTFLSSFAIECIRCRRQRECLLLLASLLQMLLQSKLCAHHLKALGLHLGKSSNWFKACNCDPS
jgi:hypothetical protein